jgi:hypothetical protein
MPVPDRRQTPRVPVEGRLRAEIMPLAFEVPIVDISFGGFRVECAAPFGSDACFEFRLTTTDGRCTERLRARAVSCQMVDRTQGAEIYSCGFAFLDLMKPAVERRVAAIIDSLTDELSVS